MVVQEDKKTLAMIMIVSFSFFNPLSTSPANAEAPLFIVGQEADDEGEEQRARDLHRVREQGRKN